MNVYVHFAVAGFSNCYVVGCHESRDAIIVDPGVMDAPLLRTIEDNHYTIRAILLTHTHASHVNGLRTLRKVYEAEIFAYTDEVLGFPCTRVQDAKPLMIEGIKIVPLAIAGHSADSVVYRVDSLLFTGDVLSAGRVGTAPNAFARALLIDAIKERLCTLPGDYLIFPGHGAPSTLESERRINPALL